MAPRLATTRKICSALQVRVATAHVDAEAEGDGFAEDPAHGDAHDRDQERLDHYGAENLVGRGP